MVEDIHCPSHKHLGLGSELGEGVQLSRESDPQSVGKQKQNNPKHTAVKLSRDVLFIQEEKAEVAEPTPATNGNQEDKNEKKESDDEEDEKDKGKMKPNTGTVYVINYLKNLLQC